MTTELKKVGKNNKNLREIHERWLAKSKNTRDDKIMKGTKGKYEKKKLMKLINKEGRTE